MLGWETISALSARLLGALTSGPSGGFQLCHSSQLPAHLNSFVEEFIAKYDIPNVAIAAVKKDNDGSYSQAIGTYGKSNAQGDHLDEHSIFGIASNSKVFAALSVGLLIEDGVKLPNGEPLQWHTKMKDIFADWQMPDERTSDLTDLVDLLSMRSGMPRHDHGIGLIPTDDIIKGWKHVRNSAELRQETQYNNWHYMVAAHIIPTLTGQPYHEFVEERIFKPIGMDTATYNVIQAKKTGHQTDGFNRYGLNRTICQMQLHEKKKLKSDCFGTPLPFGWWTEEDSLPIAGAGGVMLSATDMVKWVQELLSPQVLPAELVTKVGRPHSVFEANNIPPETGVITYGLGQMRTTYRGHQLVFHGGDLYGQHSILVRLVNGDFGMMITTNDEVLGELTLQTIGYRILDDYLGLEPIDWESRYVQKWIEQGETVDVPTDPVPPPDEKKVVGRYSHPLYGDLDVTPFHIPSEDGNTMFGAEEGDQVVLDVMSHVPLNITGPIYVSPYKKIFEDYMVLTHFSGNAFNWTLVWPRPALDENRQPTSQWLADVGVGSAYIDEDGIGMFGNFWGAGSEIQKVNAEEKMENVKERAEVWFAKQT